MPATSQPDPLEERFRNAAPHSLALFEASRYPTAGSAKGAYYYPPFPLFMERGEGCYLWDVDGTRYVDCTNHHTAQILGHNHPAVVQAIQHQLTRGIALGAPTGIETALAEMLCQRVASVDRVRFTNSGTEATLHAIRLARGFSKKPKIAKFEGGYHGSHDVVEISVAPPLDQAGPATAPYAVPTAGGISPNAAAEVLILPYNNAAAVDQLIQTHRDELACIIFDPRAGILPIHPEFAQAVERSARTNGVLLIFDEIVGFRKGTGGLQEYLGLRPDLSCFGKIVGGGFPVGAFGGRADIMDLFDNTRGPTGFFQSGTFSAHPVTMAAGLATLQELTPETFVHLETLENQFITGLRKLFERRQIGAQVITSGSVFSIYFSTTPVVDWRGMVNTDKTKAKRLFFALLEQGYFLNIGLGMCSLSAAMQPSHIDGLITAIDHALDTLND